MPDYVVTTTASEEEALQWVAANAEQDAAAYFDSRMHEVLHSYEQQHAVGTAIAPVEDVATEYAKADAQTQAAVATALGIDPSAPKPAA